MMIGLNPSSEKEVSNTFVIAEILYSTKMN